ncbi:MAG: response regulator transcription factor [Terrimicrobiaceae bacterium]|nr:response regulator transcription factor [Terrimicrobiaceae bacterium]
MTCISSRSVQRKASRVFRVLLVDDHPFVRDGLAGLLGSQPEFEIAGEAGTAGEAIAKLRELRPDAIIVDLRLPDMDGTKVLMAAREMRWKPAVIVLSAFRSDDDLLATARAGAMAFLLKTEHGGKVLETIRLVLGGENVLLSELSPSLRVRLLQKDLTDKEMIVLKLLGSGLTNKEICASTRLSENTIKTHLRAIFSKLDVSNRAEATAIALRRGLVG